MNGTCSNSRARRKYATIFLLLQLKNRYQVNSVFCDSLKQCLNIIIFIRAKVL